MLNGLKRIFKRVRKTREFDRRRRQSDYRATSLAVKLVLSGAMSTPQRGFFLPGWIRRSA